MSTQRKSLAGIGKIAVTVLWFSVLIVAGFAFHAHRSYKEPVVLGPGVTAVKTLGDYCPELKGTINDCNIYVLDSGKPGGTFLVLGGTHPEEPAGPLTALHLVENTRPTEGRLIVAIHANRSASTVTRPGEGYPTFYHIKTPSGTRQFRMGDRFANPLDSWPDPEVYINYPSRQPLAYLDVRNFNRTWPGRLSGMLAERTCYAFMQLMKKEKVDFFIDLHEAELEYPIISTIVAHQTAAPVGAMVSMMLTSEQFKLGVEYSPEALHGLSHREVGDAGVPTFVIESPEPFLDRVRGATNEALLLTGKDEFVMSAGKHRLLYESIDETGWPIALRVGRHNTTVQTTAQVWTMQHPEKPVVFEGIPSYQEVISHGVGYYLHDPAKAPADRVVGE